MSEQIFSARRCKDTRKPFESECPNVYFYHCKKCGEIAFVTNKMSTSNVQIYCCEKEVEQLYPIDINSYNENLELSYKILGGYNDNAIEVSWKRYSTIASPIWIYLKTFTGGYLKYTNKSKRSSVTFALADTDAFSYCDESPCLECVFRCKRGFIIYVYFEQIGLISIPLDKMNANWQSNAKTNN